MAQGHHQIITKPRLYTSYPLFLYASGGMDAVRHNLEDTQDLTDKELYRLITLDPSQQTEIPLAPLEGNNYLSWRILPTSFAYNSINDDNLVFNSDNSYAMILGHNCSSSNTTASIASYFEDEDGLMTGGVILDAGNTTIKNYTNSWEVPEYDGWSAWKLGGIPPMSSHTKWIGLRLSGTEPTKIGSVLFGKYWDFPQNAELTTYVDFAYGNKTKKSLSGKTISHSQWSKTDNWITEPFGLGDANYDNPLRKSGRRTWEVSFTSLAPKHITNQNMMLNSNGYTAQDNHSTGADSNSLYNAYNGVDFYTNVVKMTMGGSLPMVLNIDANDTSPSNWAIVRMKNNFRVTQKSPLLYNFKVTLEEQI